MNEDLQAPIPTEHGARRIVWIEIAVVYCVIAAVLLADWL